MNDLLTIVDINKPDLNELVHFGVPGMKWGHRKAQLATTGVRIRGKVSSAIKTHKENSEAYKQKLTNIEKHKNRINDSDYKRVSYLNKSAARRTASHLAGSMASEVCKDLFTGGLKNYQYLTNDQWKVKATKVALNAAKKMVIDEAMARSAASKYTDGGYLKKGQKDKKSKIFTREDKMEMGLRAANVVRMTAGWKANKAYQQRKRNKATFDKWGANILAEKASSIGKVRDFVPHAGYTVH